MTANSSGQDAWPALWVRHWRDAWHGRVTLARLFYVDMLVWGTILNLTTTATSLVLLATGMPIAVVLLVWASCWPWNAFLCIAVWRTAAAMPGAWSGFAGPLATLWAAGISAV